MNRSVMAARAANLPVRTGDARVSRNPALRPITKISRLREPVRSKNRAPKLTAVQKSHDGSRSLWNASAYNRPGSTPVTPAWDRTVTT